MSYDAKQIGAREVCWLCCKRPVYATNPHLRGCVSCRVPAPVIYGTTTEDLARVDSRS